MTHVTADRIYETTTTAGTGPVALGGAVSGYYTFSSAMATGDTCYYVIFDVSTGDNEEGIGTYTSSGNTLTRTTVLHSSNANALVVFGSASKTVFITAPAARLLQQNISGQVIGVPTSTAGGVVFSDTTGTWRGTTAGTAGQVILSGGAGTPTFTTGTLTLSSNFTTNGSVPVLASGLSSVVAAGTTTVLTATSLLNWTVTGSGGQTYQLPSALTLPIGATFTFNNNQSSGTIAVNNNSSTLVVSVPSGGYVTVTLLTNSLAAGTWDTHYAVPSNVSWSTNTFNVPASITGATWQGQTFALGGNFTTSGASSITLTSTGTTTLTLPTTGTVTALGNAVVGSGSIVLATSPTLTTPNIGAATGTSLAATGAVSGASILATNGIILNNNTITASTTIAAGTNGMSVGPMTIASGVTVTVTSGQRWITI